MKLPFLAIFSSMIILPNTSCGKNEVKSADGTN
jgi:hypothetical protein